MTNIIPLPTAYMDIGSMCKFPIEDSAFYLVTFQHRVNDKKLFDVSGQVSRLEPILDMLDQYIDMRREKGLPDMREVLWTFPELQRGYELEGIVYMPISVDPLERQLIETFTEERLSQQNL